MVTQSLPPIHDLEPLIERWYAHSACSRHDGRRRVWDATALSAEFRDPLIRTLHHDLGVRPKADDMRWHFGHLRQMVEQRARLLRQGGEEDIERIRAQVWAEVTATERWRRLCVLSQTQRWVMGPEELRFGFDHWLDWTWEALPGPDRPGYAVEVAWELPIAPDRVLAGLFDGIGPTPIEGNVREVHEYKATSSKWDLDTFTARYAFSVQGLCYDLAAFALGYGAPRFMFWEVSRGNVRLPPDLPVQHSDATRVGWHQRIQRMTMEAEGPEELLKGWPNRVAWNPEAPFFFGSPWMRLFHADPDDKEHIWQSTFELSAPWNPLEERDAPKEGATENA